MTKTERVLEFIRRKGTARTPEIAEACGLEGLAPSALLSGHVARGELLMCKVERPGKPPVNEYRFAAMAGGKLAEFKPLNKRGALAKTETTLGAVGQPAGPLVRTMQAAPAPQRPLDQLPIAKGIAIPDPKVLRRNIISNTLRAMGPGDSFAVKLSSVSTVYRRSKELGIGVRIAKLPDGKSARIWRLA